MKYAIDAEGKRLPIKLDATSNGEFVPVPLSATNRAANRRAHEAATEIEALGSDFYNSTFCFRFVSDSSPHTLWRTSAAIDSCGDQGCGVCKARSGAKT